MTPPPRLTPRRWPPGVVARVVGGIVAGRFTILRMQVIGTHGWRRNGHALGVDSEPKTHTTGPLVLLIAGGMTLNAPGVEDPTTDVPGIDPEDVGDTPPDANDNT